MSVIAELNDFMMTMLDKTTDEYEAIFGKEDFTPLSPIDESSDYQCGAIANELEYVKAFVDYITRTADFDGFQGTYLEKLVYYFTGLKRWYLETDEELINRFKALIIRSNNPSWITVWMIRDVMSYFVDVEVVYVTENITLDEFITDGSFELDPTVNWNTSAAGSSTVNFVSHDMFYGLTCAELYVDSSGSACSLSQTLTGVSAAHYVLNFFTKDDRLLPTDDLFEVIITRASDGYYYNFDTLEWQAASASRVISKNPGTRYESKQLFVDVPSLDDLTITFQNVGGTSDEYTFYIDHVEFGTMLDYPTVRVILVDENLVSGFTSLWPGTDDPIATYDYDVASYTEQSFVSGFGGEGLLPYYQYLLALIKTAGVYPSMQVLWRAHT